MTKKQIQAIYNVLTNIKRANGKINTEYSTPGTHAYAMLGMCLTIGEAGIHIESFKGLHKGGRATTADAETRVLGTFAFFNRHLKKAFGAQAPKLVCDIIGDKRVKWVLAPKTTSSNNNA